MATRVRRTLGPALQRARTVADRAAVQDVGRGEARRVAGQLALLLLRQLEAS